jgi:hypothetical protein
MISSDCRELPTAKRQCSSIISNFSLVSVTSAESDAQIVKEINEKNIFQRY